MDITPLLVLAATAFAAGIMNTLAGGGSFLTFPALLLTGLDARAANITSTVALFPMQITTGFAGRKLAGGTAGLSFRTLIILSLIGGVIGAILLLLTPAAFFARLVPWLILFATAVFAYGSFYKRQGSEAPAPHLGTWGAAAVQLCIAIYGGYFGDGIGFLMLAALTLAGMPIRKAGATKIILASCMNASAVLIFLFSKNIGWTQVAIGIPTSIIGGHIATRLLHKVNERYLRITVVVIGIALTVGLFLRS
jgi:uncharacterized membrane protein YfcA